MATKNVSAQGAGDGPPPDASESELEMNVTQAAPPPVELDELDAYEQVDPSAAPSPAAHEMGSPPEDDFEVGAVTEEAPPPSDLLAEIADGDSSDEAPPPTFGPGEDLGALTEDAPPEPVSIETLDRMEASE